MSIKQAQARLMSMGFPMPRFGADGDFGQETFQAFTAAMDELEERRGTTAPPPAQLRRLDPTAFAKWAPRAVEGTLDALEAAVAKYPALQDRLVLAHWLGQMWVESAGFSTLTENLNYSVDGLLKTFGRHRITKADAERYGRAPGRAADQEAIANIIYGGEWGRKNLGNTQPGDGWRFRGSGVKQITGRANTEASGYTPEELRTDIHKSVDASAQFFLKRGCDVPARKDDVVGVTKIVNGGTNGLDDRRIKTTSVKSIII